MNTTTKRLREQCENIANEISNPTKLTEEDVEWYMSDEIGEPMNPSIYLNNMCDINYIAQSDGRYKAAKVAVALGGPNIYINTETNVVEGYWGSDTVSVPFTDTMGIDDYCEDLYACIDRG